MGIDALEKFMDEKANDLEVKEPVAVVVPKNCVAGKLCDPQDMFEMISECALCGKLL